MNDSRAAEIIRRQEGLAGQRATWESHWQEIADRVLPRQAEFQTTNQPGEKRTEKIFDATASLALERFAAAMESVLTPRSQRWHRLRATDEALNNSDAVRAWFSQAEDILFAARYSPRANYASQQHETYMSLGAFGSGVMYIGEEVGRGLRYKSVHLSECYFTENADGLIDTNFRKYLYTARQAAQRWGEKALPEKIRTALEKEPDRKFEFLHAVFPREELNRKRANAQNLPYASFHIALEGRKVIAESGFEQFPYAISRYVTAPREVYGRSPAMAVLPDIKMLNEMSKTVIRAAHKAVDPPVLINHDGVLGGRPDLRPNAINYGGIDENGRPLMMPFNSNGRVDIGLEMMEQRRAVINDAFLVTLFQILVEGPQMTATEVLERAREKGALLSPTAGRQQSEALGPMIERELSLLTRAGKLPELPPELIEAEGEFEIEYDSPLTRAQRAEEGLGVLRSMEIVGPFVQFDPGIMDNYNTDEIARLAAKVNGIEKVLRPKEEVAALREQRARAQQAQSLVSAGPPVADTLNKLTQAANAAGPGAADILGQLGQLGLDQSGVNSAG